MISESGSVEALMLRSSGFQSFGGGAPSMDHSKLDRLDPMQNQLCRVCEEPAAGFHFGAFTCEGCKSFFGRTCNNQSVIQECKNNYRCVVDKKNRTACKACRLRKCIMVGMSKSGSRYGRRSNWFKIHCLMQQNLSGGASASAASGPGSSPNAKASPSGSSHSSSASTSSVSPSAPSQIGMWTSPQKNSSPEPPSHKPADRLSIAGVSPPRSPEVSAPPTMVPKTSIAESSTPSPSNPFKNFLPALSPASLPTPPVPVSLAKPELPPTSLSSALSPSSMAAAAAASASLYPHGFPFMAAPGFPGIPFHKQAMLSPLLAQSHLFQMAAASAASARHNPLFPGLRPQLSAEPTDVMAEHKALLERFASSMAAMAAAAPQAEPAVDPIGSPKSVSPQPHIKVKEEKEDEAPMDLSSRKGEDDSGCSDGEDAKVEVTSSSPPPVLSHSAASLLKADLNRNLVATAAEARGKVLDLCSKSS